MVQAHCDETIYNCCNEVAVTQTVDCEDRDKCV